MIRKQSIIWSFMIIICIYELWLDFNDFTNWSIWSMCAQNINKFTSWGCDFYLLDRSWGPTKPLPTLHRCTMMCNQNYHFWEASKASPDKMPPPLTREVSLSTYPLPVHHNLQPKSPLLRGKQSEKFPSLHTPYWSTTNLQIKKKHFWEVSKVRRLGVVSGVLHSAQGWNIYIHTFDRVSTTSLHQWQC